MRFGAEDETVEREAEGVECRVGSSWGLAGDCGVVFGLSGEGLRREFRLEFGDALGDARCRLRRGDATDGIAEDGAGGSIGLLAVARGFAEREGLLVEDLNGRGAGLRGLVGGAAEGEVIHFVEKRSDGGLIAPDQELGDGELVISGDREEGTVGFEEVVEELVGLDGDGVDLVVDGGLEGGM